MHWKVDQHGSFWPSRFLASWLPAMASCKAPGRLGWLKPCGQVWHCDVGSCAQKPNALHDHFPVITSLLICLSSIFLQFLRITACFHSHFFCRLSNDRLVAILFHIVSGGFPRACLKVPRFTQLSAAIQWQAPGRARKRVHWASESRVF